MNPTFSRRRCVSPVSSSDEVDVPSSRTSPEVGKSIAPARFSSVDFPQPLRPTNATNEPGKISRETPSTARTGCPSLRYSLETWSRLATGRFSLAGAKGTRPVAEFIWSTTLDDRGDALAHADAHGAKRVAGISGMQLVH